MKLRRKKIFGMPLLLVLALGAAAYFFRKPLSGIIDTIKSKLKKDDTKTA